jgi:hypothetical protein
MTNEKYYTRFEDANGVVTYTPVEAKVVEKKEGERSRVKKSNYYYTIAFDGTVDRAYEMCFGVDIGIFNYGNYYPTEAQAQAVADLRRHVYKFPVTQK